MSYRDVYDELLELMAQFELCYQLPHKREEFIVPALLSPDKPAYTWADKSQLQLRYEYTFMPKGIVTRLIVRLHRYIENQATVWHRGAVFAYQNAQAEVIEHYRDKKIHIKAKGPNRRALMTIIAKDIDEINSTFDFDERLSVAQLIPCNCEECKQAVSPYFFPKTVLEKARQRGRRKVECQESFLSVSILDLMEDVFISHLSTQHHIFTPNSPTMTRNEYLRQLLMDSKLEVAIREMAHVAQGSYVDSSAILLSGRYSALKREIQDGTLSAEQKNLRSNQLRNSANGLLQDLLKEVPAKMQEQVTAEPQGPDPVLEAPVAQANTGNTTIYHINGPLGSLNPNNKGKIIQHIDQRTVNEHIQPFQEMVKAQAAAAYITKEEYEDLMDILAEIQETQQPSTSQQRRWKRWLGKAVDSSSKFLGKRLEKGADTVISEEVKRWIADGGPGKLLELVGAL